MKPKIMRLLTRILGWFGVFLLLISLLLESLPLAPNSTLNTFHLAARQRALEEHIVKDVLILAYRSSPDEHAEAISEIQTALPVWERVENGLQNGDASLGISSHLPGDVKLLLVQAQPDFAYLDAAAKHILAHPSPVDQDQLLIIIQHNQNYYISMALVVNALQDDIKNIATIYFDIELCVGALLMFIWISFLVMTNKILKSKNDDSNH